MKWFLRTVNYYRIIYQFEVCDCLNLFPKQRDRHFVRHLAWWQSRDDSSVQHSKALTSVETMHTQEPEEGSIVDPQTNSSFKEDLDDTKKKPQFGTRFLTDPKNVFQHNAWDSVVWDDEQECEARQKTQEQFRHALSAEQQEAYEREADLFWDKFYSQHQNRFFKDRHWLFTEFPELYSSTGNTNKPTIPKQADEGCDDGASGLAVAVSNGLSVSASQATNVAATDNTGSTDACIANVSSNVPDFVFSVSKDSKQFSDYKSTDCTALYSGDAHCRDASSKSVKLQAQLCAGFQENDTSSSDSYPGQSATFRVFEVGCGVGNTVFPILHTNNDPNLMVYCCDFSSAAIQLVKEHRDYDRKRCHAFVWDITDERSLLPFPPASLDIIILIFVLSAVHPDKMQQAVNRLVSCLKPGGLILLRDYGRYDMAQLRFKKGRCLAENFYVRGDGTRVYFFTQEEFRNLFKRAGLVEEQNLVDRRLQVNRGRQLKMYRVWIQCKYKKPLTSDNVRDADKTLISLQQSL